MMKRTICLIAMLTACSWSSLRAADTNAPAAADTNAVAAATTNAPPADTTPKPDPAGTATGMSVDAQSPAGTFVTAAPADLSDDDKKDPAKVKTYNDAKKAFDDYTAQAKLEPLAVKLSDSVGHNRVAINFMWTLVTGFLVMFMQAGFALVETGLCRAKNAGHTMSMNFMIYPMGMLGFYLCGFAFMFGGMADPASPNNGGIATMGGYAGLNHELGFHIGTKFFGLLGTKGFLLQGAVLTPPLLRCSSSRWSSWIPRRLFPPEVRPNAGSFRPL